MHISYVYYAKKLRHIGGKVEHFLNAQARVPSNGSWSKRAIIRGGVMTAAVAYMLSFSCPAFSQTAQAQGTQASTAAQTTEAEDTAVADIVVTARGRVERLQDVPVAASVLAGVETDRVGTSVQALSTLVPSLQIARGAAGSGGTVTLRGVSTSSSNAALEQKVALALDDVQIARARIIIQGFFDTESVQVLKGPQVLFFGKNATAGVVSIRSADPGRVAEGYARAGYETVANEYSFEGAYTVPVSDTLRFRFAGRYSNMTKGYLQNDVPHIFIPLENAFNQDSPTDTVPRIRSFIGRVTTVFEPTPEFEAKLKLTIANSRAQGSRDGPSQPVCKAGQPNQGIANGPAEPYDDCVLNDHTIIGTLPANVAAGWADSDGGLGYSNFDSTLASLNLTYKFGDFTLSSVSGYGRFVSREFAESSFSAYPYNAGYTLEEYRQLSEEVRLASNFSGPFNFTVGAFWQRFDRNFVGQNRIQAGLLPDPRNGFTYSSGNLSESSGTSLSGFAQASFKFAENFELAGGARYTFDRREGTLRDTFVNSNSPAAFLPEGVIVRAEIENNDVSPEATLSWKPNNDLLIYVGYRTASLAGGISSPSILSPTTAPSNITYKPESVSGFEGGIKFSALDSALRANVTAFSYNYKDLQVSAFNNALLTYILTNVGEARSRGIEVGVDVRASSELSFRTEATYADTKYITYPGAQCYAGQTLAEGCTTIGQDLSGRPLPRAPKFTMSASATYDTPISADWKLGLTGDVRYSGGYYYTDNLNPVGYQDQFTTIGASVRVYNGPWELSVIGRNLSNVYYAGNGNDQARGRNGQVLAIIGRPREVLFQITRRL
jgi:iron complex outermembrane receptor protein